jgi:glycosyltransferase involved in cell wall biosynthesis
MGRIMTYVVQHGVMPGIVFEMVESRGGGSAIWSLWHVAIASLRIIQARAGKTPTIVHLNCGERGSVARKGFLLAVANILGMRAVLHLHAADIEGFYRDLPRVARALIAVIFRGAPMCIVLGAHWRNWLVDELAISPARITVIHNGVPQPEVVRWQERGPVFGAVFLGNLLPRKGLADLLHALATLPTEPNAALPWQLTVAGAGLDAPYRQLAIELGIADRVLFAGWLNRPAVATLLSRADVLVLPSYHEALPLVLLEAASLGVPVVATPVGAIADVFTHLQDALLVPPGDRIALGAALTRLARDPDLARQIGNNAQRLYHRAFTIEAFAAKLGDVYAGLARSTQ